MRDKKTKDSFIKYLEENPELRFWQALRNWGPFAFIYGSHKSQVFRVNDCETKEDFIHQLQDTFYLETEEKLNKK